MATTPVLLFGVRGVEFRLVGFTPEILETIAAFIGPETSPRYFRNVAIVNNAQISVYYLFRMANFSGHIYIERAQTPPCVADGEASRSQQRRG